MRAPGTAALAVVFLLVSIEPAFAQSRHPGPVLPHQPVPIRIQQDIAGPRAPGSSSTSPQGSIHLDMPQHGARTLVFPSPAPKKSPEYNPLILRREA